jgi:hypothetical protein
MTRRRRVLRRDMKRFKEEAREKGGRGECVELKRS